MTTPFVYAAQLSSMQEYHQGINSPRASKAWLHSIICVGTFQSTHWYQTQFGRSGLNRDVYSSSHQTNYAQNHTPLVRHVRRVPSIQEYLLRHQVHTHTHNTHTPPPTHSFTNFIFVLGSQWSIGCAIALPPC